MPTELKDEIGDLIRELAHEYGTTTETKASEEGISCRALCNKYHALHKEIYDWFQISFDYFGRTSTDNPRLDNDHIHTKIAQNIFIKLYKNGYIFEQLVDQFWCDNCGKFLADRYITGTCKYCGSEGAKGDQCDNCTHLLSNDDILSPRCKKHGSELSIKKSKHLFLDLPKLLPKLKQFINDKSNNWTNNAQYITKAWLEQGLLPRCITRDLQWGTPVPKIEGLEGYDDKILYVWFDAPIGYMSITANYTEEWEKWWKEAEIINFMAKDNVPFHSIIFPATLIGCDEEWRLFDRIDSVEYLNYDGRKFSKSNGIGVFGDDAKNSGISVDVWRYYLLMLRPENNDSNFNWNDLQTKNNNELCANIGNCINRLLGFIAKKCKGIIPIKESEWIDIDQKYILELNNLTEEYIEMMDKVKLSDGIRKVMEIASKINMYYEDNRFWNLIKNDDKTRANTVMNLSCNFIVHLAILLKPFLPNASNEIFNILNIDKENIIGLLGFVVKGGHQMNPIVKIFKLIEDEKIDAFIFKFK